MAKDIIFTTEAEEDADNGYFWYESKRTGLGREFLTAVDAAIQAIHRNPKLYQVIYKSYRRAIVRRFPYTILYEETDIAIIIYAVLHVRQDPETWQERLP